MTDGLSRRDLVVLAGAGLAVSACEANGRLGLAPRVPANEAEDDRSFSFLSAGDPWGDDPHNGPPPGRMQEYQPFLPGFIALLYLAFETDGKIRMNHASYPMPQSTPESRLKKAKDVFSDITSTRYRRFKDSKDTYHPYVRENYPYRDHVDSETFKNFRFKSQTELFIFIHHPAIELDRRYLISFSNLTQDGDPASQNFSFYNASPVSAVDLGTLNDIGKMIRMENYVAKKYGHPISVDNLPYSMNIHYTAPMINALGTSEGRIPMVFDPDTGNGQGNEP